MWRLSGADLFICWFYTGDVSLILFQSIYCDMTAKVGHFGKTLKSTDPFFFFRRVSNSTLWRLWHFKCMLGYFGISTIHQTLIWTTGSLTCVCDLFCMSTRMPLTAGFLKQDINTQTFSKNAGLNGSIRCRTDIADKIGQSWSNTICQTVWFKQNVIHSS